MKPFDVFYRHLRSPPGWDVGVVTACCRVISSTEDLSELQVAYAFCSPYDQFCKAKGRAIARTRIDSQSRQRVVQVDHTKKQTVKQAIKLQLEEMLDQSDPICPPWLRYFLYPEPF